MSDDDDRSSSGSESEDLSTTGLIATRAKRATAGNLYATLRANLDDEELQKDLLAEDEEDEGDYEGSDREDDDAAMESSSDEEDAGPPKDGEKEDLEGEKELKKRERAEAKKKRKMEEAKMRLPVWQRKKKVKLADDVKTEDGAPVRPKKKSERSNWLPTAADMPVRQSSRSTAVANREVVHANLKESALRSEKQKRVMANHAARSRANQRAELSQEERLAKASKIEKETAREFGRWEREEAERQRIREEQLAAKRNRGISGPVIRHWSGSVLWEGEKIRNKRLHGSQNVDDIKDEKDEDPPKAADADVIMLDNAAEKSTVGSTKAMSTVGVDEPASSTTAQTSRFNPSDAPISWLDGIQEYGAVQPTPVPAQPTQFQPPLVPLHQSPYTPSAPAINAALLPKPPLDPLAAYRPVAPPLTYPQASTPPVYHGWPPGQPSLSGQHTQIPLPSIPPAPLIKEQAQRSLIMLEQFEELENSSISKRGSSKPSRDASLDPTPIASTLLPLSYPSFNPEETRYLTARLSKKKGVDNILPPVPAKTICALTTWPAKFRDPKTGLPYADMQQYKMIQRLLAGGCSWSSLLGAWVGPQYGSMGRSAVGVPDGFVAPPSAKGSAEIKTESAV